MRVFNCLSKNVSMALERSQQRPSSDRRPKNRLNFRNKKRRAATSSHNTSNETLGTPSKKHASSTTRSKDTITTPAKNVFQDENAPPPSSTNYASVNSTTSSVTTRKTLVPPTKPLPAIPTSDLDISIFIKELDDSLDDMENLSDYLPLAHIEPPLTEEETTASSSSPSPLQRRQRRLFRSPGRHGNSDYTASTGSATSTTSGISVDSPSSTSSSQNIYQQIYEVNANSIASSQVSTNVKSVGCLDKAFIQSSSSLPRLKNVLSSTRLDDCTNRASRRVQKKVSTATASTSTSDIKPLMTYSRRKAAYAKIQTSGKKQQRQQQPQRLPERSDYCFYNDEAILPRCDYSNYSSSDSLSSRVEEVSDLLEASVAEYDSYKQNTLNTETYVRQSGGSSRGTNRRTDSTVEVCNVSEDRSVRSGYDGGCFSGQAQTPSQISADLGNDCDQTQLSQFANEDLTQEGDADEDTIVTGVYSRLVDYTASTTASSTATASGDTHAQSQFDDTQVHEVSQEETRFYENEVRPLRLCEGESQSSLVSPKGFLRHQRGVVGGASASSINSDVTAYNSDYSQVNPDNSYQCASQSSFPSYLGETELTADYYDDTTSDVTSPSYVNVPRECSSRTNGGDTVEEDDVTTDADNVTCSNSRASEFLGCMSFGVPHLLKKVSG